MFNSGLSSWAAEGRYVMEGRQYSYIRVLLYKPLLKSIVCTVCEHEYMNVVLPQLNGSSQLMFLQIYL